MHLQLIATVLAVLVMGNDIDAASSNPYCILCADHTMCKYPATPAGSACAPKLGGGVTAAEQATILKVHNAERSKVALGKESRGAPGPQPAAANMVKLVWNAELAKVAQRWADQCTFGHDTCRKLATTSAGQNVYMASSWTSDPTPSTTAPTSDWTGAVNAWNDEVAIFNKASVAPFVFSSGTGHYSQAIWATTTSVGCGRTAFKENSTSQWTHQLYVCNYAPAGNMISSNSAIYQIGKACSKCPSTRPKCETATGLCTA